MAGQDVPICIPVDKSISHLVGVKQESARTNLHMHSTPRYFVHVHVNVMSDVVYQRLVGIVGQYDLRLSEPMAFTFSAA